MKRMTIIKAIQTVLLQRNEGLDLEDIYNEIVQQKLYSFNAKNPKAVVAGEIRCHCLGLDFPSAAPIKYFYIVKLINGKAIYDVIEKLEQGHIPVNEEIVLQEQEDELPEETVERTISDYNKKIKAQLLTKIMNNNPAFFEQLVVTLLLKMGYGYDKNSGLVVGGAHDGGIDGIISEDKLGLDQIYIQAKRYARDNTVGRKELQAFIGAMQGVEKGVFFTTSSFTSEGKAFINTIQGKHVRLIDGEMLLDFMLKFEVGVKSLKDYRILKIDDEYFKN